MEKKIVKIVLTGGPAAGKTTLISRVLKEFKQEDGWKVITIPETATELISGFGIGPFPGGPGRVAQQHAEAQAVRHGFYLLTYVAHADDADGGAFQLDGPPRGDAVEGAEDVIGHAAGIAAFGILYVYSVGGAPRQVDVVHADGGTGDHLHPRAGKRFFVALGSRSDDDGIGIYHSLVVNGPPVHIHYLCVGLQDAF